MPIHIPSHRWLAGLLALVLHAGFAYGLSQAQGTAAPAAEARPLRVHYLSPPKVKAAPPKPVPQPKAETPPPKAPPVKRKPRPKPLLASKTASAAPVAAPPQAKPTPLPSRPAAKPAPAPVPISAARSDLDYLANPAPSYPALSRRLGEEGTVLLRVAVSASGEAGVVDLERSSGHERLDQAALRAVRRWRFEPARQAGAAVASVALVPVEFELKKKS
ncbi:MAG: energy transducer TonB [Gammaproteobacteria bacterium]|nr:energy transducer TonB [Gammaproteobacteria bacterium]